MIMNLTTNDSDCYNIGDSDDVVYNNYYSRPQPTTITITMIIFIYDMIINN